MSRYGTYFSLRICYMGPSGTAVRLSDVSRGTGAPSSSMRCPVVMRATLRESETSVHKPGPVPLIARRCFPGLAAPAGCIGST